VSEERAQLPFEATMPPRRWMGAAAIAGGLFYAATIGYDVLFDSRASSHFALTVVDLAFRGAFALFAAFFLFRAVSEAVGEFARWTLRITTERLEYEPPKWMARWPTWGGVSGATIEAADVRHLAWDGYDNIGIELKSGQIVRVNFRNRIAQAQHEAARLAVLAFVAHASGEPTPAPALDVAPWVVRNPPRVRV
jgi:hypothetical protein